ncbi:MAG: DUF6982 domain-containing protein [Candidatus Acidiferrales bacterium]
MKSRPSATTRKKVVVVLQDRKTILGYLNPSRLGQVDVLDLLTLEGGHREVGIDEVRSVHFVREFRDQVEIERKAFFARPKLDGLWVRLRFPDNETLEGLLPNDLLDLLANGLQITPPDMNGNTQRIFIPRIALAELKVLGVVGVARRKAPEKVIMTQPGLFEE